MLRRMSWAFVGLLLASTPLLAQGRGGRAVELPEEVQRWMARDQAQRFVSWWFVGLAFGKGSLSAQGLNRNPEWDEAVCKNLSRRAGDRGGEHVGTPGWVRILTITVGSSMAARMGKGPPHCEQVVRSMASV